MNWWIICMKKYVDFSGRARRAEYWMFTLFSIVFAIAAIVLDNVLGLVSEDTGYGVLYALFTLGIIFPGWAVTVRRLHDIGKSGWWILVDFIPYIGSIWLFVLTVMDSQPGDNQYGANPKLVRA